MRHEMLTQRALFCHRANTKRGTLSQHFVTHVVPPLSLPSCKQPEKRVSAKAGLWTLDWTMDWTLDWNMDSILDSIIARA